MTDRDRRIRRNGKNRSVYRRKKKRQNRLLLTLFSIVAVAGLFYYCGTKEQLFRGGAPNAPEYETGDLQNRSQELTNKNPNDAEERKGSVPTNTGIKEDYVSSIGLLEVEKPIARTRTEAIEQLHLLETEYPLMETILKNIAKYPENMLKALANNPEMADFVAGYPGSGQSTKDGLTKTEQVEEYPLFLQWDPRWGYESYGDDSCIGLAGCGPTCMSMVLYYLTGNETLTPDVLAAYAMKNGYYAKGHGTAWTFMEDVAGHYGVAVQSVKAMESAMKAELDSGGVIICAMRAGDFTTEGHFIVIYGYDEEGFQVNDPNCVARSRKRWTMKELEKQTRSIWAYHKRNTEDAKDVKAVWSSYEVIERR